MGRCWIIFLNNLRRIQWSNLFFQDFSYIWNNLSPFFHIPVWKYYLLLKDSVLIFYIYFFQCFFTLWFFLTYFENSIFYKIPAAAARISSRKAGYGKNLEMTKLTCMKQPLDNSNPKSSLAAQRSYFLMSHTPSCPSALKKNWL